MLRFAPSPAGDMHISNMRVALMNYIVAKQRGEQFVVRIEDTDKARNIEGKDQEILDILKKFTLNHDQLFYQSENLGRHQQFAVSLLEQEKAFLCLCTPEELEADHDHAKSNKEAYRYSGKCLHDTEISLEVVKKNKTPYVIRIKNPTEPIVFTDTIKGEITTQPNEVDSFVILRADGTPTDNFACACDDILTDISLIIRGEEHLSNTPKQIHIKQALGYTTTVEYAHLPIILNAEGKKMSRHDDGNSIKWMLEQGFLPDAIINYLLLLGNKTPTEVFTLPDALEWFSLETLSKSAATFDIDKLRFLNREQFRAMDDMRLSRIFGFGDADIGKLLKIYLDEASTMNELESKIKGVFTPKPHHDEWQGQMETIATVIRKAPMINDLDTFQQYIIDQSGLKDDNLFKPLQLLMTGAEHGPELSDVYPLIKPYITEVARCQP